MNAYFACAAHAEKPKGVSVEKLSKIWRIDLETAKKTVKATTQRCGRFEEHMLSRNYSTNDRMLRHKHIKEHFFIDTFFATKKVEPSLSGHTCMQLFVTDKGLIHVLPMKSKSEVLQAVKQFSK